MSDFFLGVDGGPSSTTALVGDAAGKIVGWSSAGPCNHVAAIEAQAKFLRVIGECIGQAAARAGMGRASDASPWHFRSACLGMSGGPDDKDALLRELVQAAHLTVTHDAMIALAGATGGEPGIVVIARHRLYRLRPEPARRNGEGRRLGSYFRR